jgi:prepilin-type N-terminal cleavage/methylation domain-containing protein
MILNKIKSNAQQEKGFTIVELLIVVVVIAILAAITIVSYNGITNRANASAAQSTAASLQKKAELYAADGPTGLYPAAIGDLTTGTGISSKTYYIAPGSINIAAPTAANGKNTVNYAPCGTPITGAKITWYNFVATGTKETDITLGTCA